MPDDPAELDADLGADLDGQLDASGDAEAGGADGDEDNTESVRFLHRPNFPAWLASRPKTTFLQIFCLTGFCFPMAVPDDSSLWSIAPSALGALLMSVAG